MEESSYQTSPLPQSLRLFNSETI